MILHILNTYIIACLSNQKADRKTNPVDSIGCREGASYLGSRWIKSAVEAGPFGTQQEYYIFHKLRPDWGFPLLEFELYEFHPCTNQLLNQMQWE
jgi:hypothetical protein